MSEPRLEFLTLFIQTSLDLHHHFTNIRRMINSHLLELRQISFLLISYYSDGKEYQSDPCLKLFSYERNIYLRLWKSILHIQEHIVSLLKTNHGLNQRMGQFSFENANFVLAHHQKFQGILAQYVHINHSLNQKVILPLSKLIPVIEQLSPHSTSLKENHEAVEISALWEWHTQQVKIIRAFKVIDSALEKHNEEVFEYLSAYHHHYLKELLSFHLRQDSDEHLHHYSKDLRALETKNQGYLQKLMAKRYDFHAIKPQEPLQTALFNRKGCMMVSLQESIQTQDELKFITQYEKKPWLTENWLLTKGYDLSTLSVWLLIARDEGYQAIQPFFDAHSMPVTREKELNLQTLKTNSSKYRILIIDSALLNLDDQGVITFLHGMQKDQRVVMVISKYEDIVENNLFLQLGIFDILLEPFHFEQVEHKVSSVIKWFSNKWIQ